jgi:hypothetical protein
MPQCVARTRSFEVRGLVVRIGRTANLARISYQLVDERGFTAGVNASVAEL